MADNLLPCPRCGGDPGRYNFDPLGCACARPTEGLRRYAMVFDGDEGWTMLPDPDGEYVKFEDLDATKISEKLLLMSARGDIAPMSSKDALVIATTLSAKGISDV